MPQTQFVPVDPNQLVGPYPQQSVVPQPSTPPSQVGGGSKAGAIAKIFTEFVGGAAQGRIRKFSMEQNEKLKNIAILGQYVQSVESDPTKTDEYKALVRQKYFSALGMETLKSFDEKGGKGKKGKGGAGDQQQQGPAGMIAGVLKHVATGLVGGEMPKGAPDVNPHELIGQMEAEYHGNQDKYSVQNLQSSVSAKVQGALQGSKDQPEAKDQQEAYGRLAPLMPEINRAFGNQAQGVLQTWLGKYQPRPEIGSHEYYRQKAVDSLAGQPPQPPGISPSLSSEALANFNLAGDVQQKNIVFTDPSGKKVGPVLGYEVNTGRGLAWYVPDENGSPKPVHAADIHEVGTAQPAEAKLGPVVSAPAGIKDAYGKPLPEGSAVRFGTMDGLTGYFRTVHKDLSKGDKIMGSSAPPGSTDVWGRPLNPGQLYTTFLDENKAPKAFIPEAMETAYKLGMDDEGKPYAIPVPKYETGGAPPPSPGSGTKPPASKPATPPKAPAKTEKQTKAEQTAGAPNPFRTPAAPATPKAEQPKDPGMPKGAISLGSAKGVKLSSLGTRSLGYIDADMKMVQDLKELLEQKDEKGRQYKESGAGNFWERLGSKAKRLGIWGEYKAGIADPKDKSALDRATAFIAMDQILGGLPYMQGRFNMKYLEEVQQHIPSPTDTPSMMYEKSNWMLKNLPIIRASIIEAETTRNVGGKLVGGAANQSQPQLPQNPYR